MTDCNCKICTQHRVEQDILDRGNLNEIKMLVENLQNKIANVETDLGFTEAVCDGATPRSIYRLLVGLDNWFIRHTGKSFIPYTHEDIALLCLKVDRDKSVVQNIIVEELLISSPKPEEDSDKIKFLFFTSFDDVPLYINDPDLKDLVKWRLEIGK